EARRVIVDDILEEADAYRRGLRYGDEVVAFGGRSVSTVNAFKNVLGIFPAGWRVPLSFTRNGQRTDTLVRLRGVHSRAERDAMLAGKPKKPEGKRGDPQPEDPEHPPDGHEPQPGDDPVPKTPPKIIPPKGKRPAMPKREAKQRPMPEIIKK